MLAANKVDRAQKRLSAVRRQQLPVWVPRLAMIYARFLCKVRAWVRLRSSLVRQCLAEFLGVFVLIVSCRGWRVGLGYFRMGCSGAGEELERWCSLGDGVACLGMVWGVPRGFSEAVCWVPEILV